MEERSLQTPHYTGGDVRMRITLLSKMLVVGAIVVLATVNAYAASIPRYTVRNSEVTYPLFAHQDRLQVLPLPSILGPTTNTFLPTRVIVNCGNLTLYALNGIGTIGLQPPTTTLPTLNCNLEVSGYKSNRIITYYGVSLGKTSIITPIINAFKVGKNVMLISLSKCLIIIHGRYHITKGIKSTVIQGNYKLISIIPERLYHGVYTWKTELRLQQLLSLLSA